MRILISGRNRGVTDEMKTYAHQKVEKLVKFFERATTARVTLDQGHGGNQVEMIVEVARGQTLVVKAEAADMFAACDLAERKLAQQMRRFKERLTDHHRGERPPSMGASAEAAGEPETSYEDAVEELGQGE